jgi:hypothetical protein
MKTLRTAFCALFLFTLVAAPRAQAQTPWQLGPELGVNLENDELLLGVLARIHLSSIPISLNPGFEFYPSIDSPESLFVLNFDVQYELDAQSVNPYVGGGISWARASTAGDSDSEAGLNLKGGVVFNRSGNGQPFVEAVLNFAGGNESLIFKAGLLFTL